MKLSLSTETKGMGCSSASRMLAQHTPGPGSHLVLRRWEQGDQKVKVVLWLHRKLTASLGYTIRMGKR